jgi:LPS export ABC transporter protein LptC/lipopolysaccharide transport protein LptA
MSRKLSNRSFTILKWIPRFLILGVIGFSVYVYLSYGQAAKESEAESEKKRKKRVVQEVKGIEYSHFDKGVKVYEVHAKKNRKMKNQQQQLDKPLFIFFDEQEKETIRVTGKKCNISRDYNTITVMDDVVVKSKNGMTVNADLLKYDSGLRQFHTPTPAKFHWKTMSGKARGFVYKIEEEMLILPEDPKIHYVNKAGDNKQPIIITGTRGAVDRKSGFAYFDENVEVTQGRDWIHADRIEVNFKPGDNDVEKIVARNNVKIKFAKPGKGKNKEDAAKAATVEASAPVTKPDQAPKMSNVFVADEASGKDLEANEVELYFFEDGTTIRSFRSTGNCTFVLHTYDKRNKPFENRIIKGDQFDASFDGNGDMEFFHAIKNVTVNVQPAGPGRKKASPQTIYCEDLNAFFVPSTGEVKEIHFDGGFKHVQNDRTVSSKRAIYYGKDGKTDLIETPRIQDASFNLTSEKMFLYEQTSAIHAEGNVKSEFIKSEGKSPRTFPFASPSNQPVYISAEKMDWDSHKSEAIYTGKAKLWQEKNVITAARMTINDKEKTLSAYDKVHTIFYNQKKEDDAVAEEAEKKAKKKEQKATQTAPGEDENKLMVTPEKGEDGPISVDAAIMNYVEKDRIIHFEKDVKIVTPSTKINSEKADFYLKDKSSEFDRLYAQGKVTIFTEQKRGTGKQATFFSDGRKLILEGNPKLQEPGKADILGQVLTLFLADGRILIDGLEDGRATTTLEMLDDSGSKLAPQKTTTSKTTTSKGAGTKGAPKPPNSKKAPDAGSKDRKPNQKL